MHRPSLCILAFSAAIQSATAIPSIHHDNKTHDPTAPMPSSPSVPPIERHPSNDDWGTTYIAIGIMSLIVFFVLGILVKRSFQLVPTGVMALRTLVGGRPSDGYHVLANDEEESERGEQRTGVDGEPDVGQARLEEDARVLYIIREQPRSEDEERPSTQNTDQT
ncbi:hypothetical protein LPJ57_005108 [Coemansia sp. RSA 486]|nr:hypothetical protein LPJ57_005108 [Coemansia sp. RSA 486]KAJ2233214.1 hypothetical protein IWW45_004363 [Coemansia sp. RSA 485]